MLPEDGSANLSLLLILEKAWNAAARKKQSEEHPQMQEPARSGRRGNDAPIPLQGALAVE